MNSTPTVPSVQIPTVRIVRGMSRRLRRGHPWLFSNEIEMTPETKALPPGTVVSIMDTGGERLGVGTFNSHSLIAIRLISRVPDQAIDQAFLAGLLRRALALRDLLTPAPYYRLIHSEADGLPGLVIDRYGDVVVLQVNTAGMELLLPEILAALDEVLSPSAVVLHNDTPIRALEGLESYFRVAKGSVDGPVPMIENGAHFLADLNGGQKTGWFHDQRDNRAFVASLCPGRTMIDLYSYTGGFAIQAARAGAKQITAVDRSEPALALALQAAELNGVADMCRFVRAEAFSEMERLDAAKERFDVVVCDPPAFVKSKKDHAAGLKGYRKMVRLAAALVESEGFLFAASCSHHVTTEEFAEEVARGIALAGRSGRILRSAGAGPDHPLHPAVPESAYLKAMVLQLD